VAGRSTESLDVIRNVIRPFEPRDMEETLRLFRDACAASHPFLAPAFIRAIERRMREHTLLEFETEVLDDGGVKAFLCRTGSFVDALFVDPPFQSRGLGKLLLDHLKARTRIAHLSVFAQNPRAIKFYQREEFWATKVIEHRQTGETIVLLQWKAKNDV
jgi:putative acetyltransferase